MRFSTGKYLLQEGFLGLFKNRLMTIASVITIAACVFIISGSYCIVSNIDFVLENIEQSVVFSVFIDDELKTADIEKLETELKSFEHVESVVYISSEEALEIAKEMWEDNGILDGLEEDNPLSRSFEIHLDHSQYQKEVVEQVEKVDGVSKVRHAQKAVDVLLIIGNGARIGSAILILILSVISVVIVMNTIKISVYVRRYEIGIMKYVGATNWFIRWPFIIEGIFMGFVGALLPLVMTFVAYRWLENMFIQEENVILSFVTLQSGAMIFAVLAPVAIISGIVIGIIGSVTSIRKYLEV